MELRHLRYFMAVAEELHFGKAADKLCIAQPPLSQQIQQLEREIGFALFSRTSRMVALTDAGRAYLEDVRILLAGLESAVTSARRVARGEVGRLSIGFVGSATFSVLPEALRLYRLLYPEVNLTLRELVSARQADALREHRIHVGLARPRVVAPDLVCETVIAEPLVAALPATHSLSSHANIPFSSLADEEFVLFPTVPAPSYGEMLFKACAEAGFVPRVCQETAEIQTAISLVAGGLGVTLVPASAANTRRHGVAFVGIQEPSPTSELCVVYRRDETSATVHAFIKVIREM